MTKLDWSKGYTLDPARVQRGDDFTTPDRPTEKKSKNGKWARKSTKAATGPSPWASAMKAMRTADKKRANVTSQIVDQETVLAAFGVKKGSQKGRASTLKLLRSEGILLSTGRPNPLHPKVVQIAADNERGSPKVNAKTKAKRHKKVKSKS